MLATSNRVFMQDAEKRGQMMVQLMFVVTASVGDTQYVLSASRHAQGPIGDRWVKGMAICFGETLLTPNLASDEEILGTFWSSIPLQPSGSVPLKALGYGVSSRTKRHAGSAPDRRRHIFLVYHGHLQERFQSLAGLQEFLAKNEMAGVLSDKISDALVVGDAIEILERVKPRNLMDECVLAMLQQSTSATVERRDGENFAYLRSGSLPGNPTSILVRWLARAGVASVVLTMVIAGLLLWPAIAHLWRLSALFR